MKAYLVDSYRRGAPLRLADVPEPHVGPTDVLVQVRAVSLNQLDPRLRDGEFRFILPYTPPFIAGHDVAGTVVRVGAGVRKFKEGDEVYARPSDGRIGTFADYIAIDEADIALKPRNLNFEQAASLPLVGLTAWQVLVELAGLGPGQKVFIQGGSGGVGTIAIQLARHLGATVATTTSATNTEMVRQLGAHIVVDYRKEDFAAILSNYDVVLNSQDNATLMKSLRVVHKGGLIVSISGPPDPQFARDRKLNPALGLALRLISSRIRSEARKRDIRYTFHFSNGNGAQLGRLAELVESATIRPVIDRVYDFEDLNAAMSYLEAGRARGKVVVSVP